MVPSAAKAAEERAGAYVVHEHQMSATEVAALVDTHVDPASVQASRGLSGSEADARLRRNGRNELAKRKQTPELLKFLKHVANPLLLLLIVAATLAFVSYGAASTPDITNVYIGSVLVVVVLALALAAYLNERAAFKVTNSLASLLPSMTTVIRDGRACQVPAATVVVGDIVHLTIGTRVPADTKIVESRDLKLDFSSLTGESKPIAMTAVAQHEAVHESRNIAFMSSQVLSGEGFGIVIRCGNDTFLGKMNSLTFGVALAPSNLSKDVNAFVRFVAYLSIVMGVVLFSVGLARGAKFIDAFVNGLVTTLVANVPQGLPATVTALLATSATKLRDDRVVVKRADIIESLGAATRIASDKTGTLTQNKMTVMNCWVNGQYRSASDILASAAPRGVARVSRVSRLSAGLQRLSRTASGKRGSAAARRASLDLAGNSGPVSEADEFELKSVGGGRRGGTDLLSRMSMGVIGESSSFARSSAMTFAINMNAAIPEAPGTLFASLSPLSQLLTIACCNNAAQFAAGEKTSNPGDDAGAKRILGDATDSGLLRFAEALVDVDATRGGFANVFTVPFNSSNKFAVTLCRIPEDPDHLLVTMKGAPEVVVQRCSSHWHRGQANEIDALFLEDMHEAYRSFGLLAERVIGFAFKVVPRSSLPRLPTSQDDAADAGLLEGLTFSGLLSLIDPPRDTIGDAVRAARAAGVAVSMVTGDHPTTAEAIARKCNIITLPTRREVAAQHGMSEAQVPIADPEVQALIVTGAMIDALKTDEDWDLIMDKEELVFARTTPQHKLAIVSHFQRRGELVAVTGDGVNDAPALRQADVGVAMGNPGSSEVAREAADIVLLDDDFSALVGAIAEGRRLYDNLKKTIAYTMTHIPAEVYTVILYLLLGMPLGLGSLAVLTIDLGTEQCPAASLAFEPAESNLMTRPPRNIKSERLVSRALYIYMYLIAGSVESVVSFGAWLWTFRYHGVQASDIFWLDPSLSQWQFKADSVGADAYSGGRVFNAEEQASITRQAATAWYMTIILSQFCHIWLVKTRRVSVFQHKGIVSNRQTWFGVVVAISIMLVVAYVPALQTNIFYTENPPAVCAWTPWLAFLAFMLPYTELVKKHARERPNSAITKWLAW